MADIPQGEKPIEEKRPSYLDTEAEANKFKRGTQELPKVVPTTFDDRSEEGKTKRKSQAVEKIIKKLEGGTSTNKQ